MRCKLAIKIKSIFNELLFSFRGKNKKSLNFLQEKRHNFYITILNLSQNYELTNVIEYSHIKLHVFVQRKC